MPTAFKKQHGFTLLEVLVALAVLAAALGALIKVTTQYADNAGYLRDKHFAHWSAMNYLTEMRIQQAWPDTGVQEGTSRNAERNWHWRLHVSQTPDPELRRLDMSVFMEEQAEALVLVTGYIGRPSLQHRESQD